MRDMEAKQKESKFVSVVAYIHNNEKEIGIFYNMLSMFLEKNFLCYEIIFVDDCSVDKSTAKIRSLPKKSENAVITLIELSYYQGLESAMSAGMDLAIGDFIYEFDNILAAYKEQDIWDVYQKTQGGYDIVAACPRKHRHNLARVYYFLFNHFSDAEYKIRTESFRILSRRAVNRIYTMGGILPYRKAAYAKSGLPICGIEFAAEEYIPPARNEERSSQKDAAINALILYTNFAYKAALTLSILMIAFTLACCAYIAAVYWGGNAVPGYVSTFAIAAFGFFGVNVLITVIIKYMSLLLRIVFSKKKYIIKGIEKI